MKTLSLFRHAKSDWNDFPALDDFERPLAKRGIKSAPQMAAVMREHSIIPDLILCSPAARTRQTLSLIKETAWSQAPHTIFDQRLYHADPATILEVIKAYAGDAAHIMVVGHNPGLQNLAARFSSHEGAEPDAFFEDYFPTAALATFTFDIDSWQEVSHHKGHLVLFKAPRPKQAA